MLVFPQNLSSQEPEALFACGREAKATHLSLAHGMSPTSCFHVAGEEAGRRVTRDANVTAESEAPEKTTRQQSSTVGTERLYTSVGRCSAAVKLLESLQLLSLISFFICFVLETSSAKPQTDEATTPTGIFFFFLNLSEHIIKRMCSCRVNVSTVLGGESWLVGLPQFDRQTQHSH